MGFTPRVFRWDSNKISRIPSQPVFGVNSPEWSKKSKILEVATLKNEPNLFSRFSEHPIYTQEVERLFIEWCFRKDYCFGRVYNQQFQGTIILMVFDFLGIYLKQPFIRKEPLLQIFPSTLPLKPNHSCLQKSYQDVYQDALFPTKKNSFSSLSPLYSPSNQLGNTIFLLKKVAKITFFSGGKKQDGLG